MRVLGNLLFWCVEEAFHVYQTSKAIQASTASIYHPSISKERLIAIWRKAKPFKTIGSKENDKHICMRVDMKSTFKYSCENLNSKQCSKNLYWKISSKTHNDLNADRARAITPMGVPPRIDFGTIDFEFTVMIHLDLCHKKYIPPVTISNASRKDSNSIPLVSSSGSVRYSLEDLPEILLLKMVSISPQP